MASTVVEIVWLVELFEELGISLKQLVSIYCDSESVVQIASNLVFHECTKHIEFDCHFIREKIQLGMVQPVYLQTSEQPAELFTKGLTHVQHGYLLTKLGMKNVSYTPSLREDVKQIVECIAVS